MSPMILWPPAFPPTSCRRSSTDTRGTGGNRIPKVNFSPCREKPAHTAAGLDRMSFHSSRVYHNKPFVYQFLIRTLYVMRFSFSVGDVYRILYEETDESEVKIYNFPSTNSNAGMGDIEQYR